MKNIRKDVVCVLTLVLLSVLVSCGADDRESVSLTDGSIVSVSIIDRNIVSENDVGEIIANGSIAEGSIANGGIAVGSIADGSTENGSIGGGSVENGSIADGSIAGGSITGGNAVGEIENADTGNQSEQWEQDPLGRENGQKPDAAEDKYKSILLGNADFICEDLENQSLSIKDIGRAITDDDSVIVRAVKFAIMDLDGDGGNEVVLWLQVNGISDVGFEVLHSQDETIYGYTQYYREFMDLKADGTFTFSGGSADSGIGRLIFSGNGCSVDKQVYSQSAFDSNYELAIQYFLNGAPCSEDEFYNTCDKQEQKADAEWYDLSSDSIESIFHDLT